jgi:hypothetical protein
MYDINRVNPEYFGMSVFHAFFTCLQSMSFLIDELRLLQHYDFLVMFRDQSEDTFYTLTHSLTPHSTVLLDKLTGL